jgi:pyruvate,water dikinase
VIDLGGRAVISATHANLNLRFGYHVVVLDAVCGQVSADNYIVLRFSGGGADIEKRRLRAIFLSRVVNGWGLR